MRWRKWELEKKIKHHEKQRDWYCNARAKKVWQKDIDALKKILKSMEANNASIGRG